MAAETSVKSPKGLVLPWIIVALKPGLFSATLNFRNIFDSAVLFQIG